MREPVEVEIAAELAVDARQQVQVEGGVDAGLVVISAVENCRVLLQVGADQHLAAGTEQLCPIRQECDDLAWLEIADRRAREKADALAIGSGKLRQHKGPGVIGADRDHRELWKIGGEPRRRAAQLLARNVDRDIGGRPIERLEQDAHLVAGAAAELDETAMRTDAGGDIGGETVEDRDLGARQIILGQLADLLEQSRAARVVEKFTRQRFGVAAEPGEDRVAKAFLARREVMKRKTGGDISHHRSSARRSPEKAQRAEGGKKLR